MINTKSLANSMINLKEKSLNNGERQEIINHALERLGPRRLYDVYLKALCMKSCHFNNRPLRVNNFSLQGPHRTFAEDIEVLDCGSIIDKNYDLKIKVGTYFEIIKLIKSKHKKLSSSGHSNLGRRYTHTSHLIALFINDAGEWMTVGFDGMGISSPDIYFKMDCNYLLRQEYLDPDINGSQLRTNRSKETIQNIQNIYTER